MTRGIELVHSASSPLAQMYQPMHFDNDDDVDQHGEGQQGAGSGYTPRRRLSSMQRREAPIPSSQESIRRFPALSESPGEQGRSRGPSETVSQLEDSGCGTGLLVNRFDRLEERQKRIEDLLTHLTSSLRR